MSYATNIGIFNSNSYLGLCERLHCWKYINGGVYLVPYPQLPHSHIAALLGYATVIDMLEEWKDDDSRTLDALCGPHGYTIYRMLLINRQLLPEEK